MSEKLLVVGNQLTSLTKASQFALASFLSVQIRVFKAALLLMPKTGQPSSPMRIAPLQCSHILTVGAPMSCTLFVSSRCACAL